MQVLDPRKLLRVAELEVDSVSKQSAPAEKASDPNMAGSQDTQSVKVPVAGKMTPSDEYDQNEPYHKPKGVA